MLLDVLQLNLIIGQQCAEEAEAFIAIPSSNSLKHMKRRSPTPLPTATDSRTSMPIFATINTSTTARPTAIRNISSLRSIRCWLRKKMSFLWGPAIVA